MNNQSINYLQYGIKTNSIEVKRFIEHILSTNTTHKDIEKVRVPICIWGMHGIGKTELVKQIAEELKYEFAYIAPAQFEEMGDLVGMPAIVDGKTVFCEPEWVPTQVGPGILLIDDVNRADDRILRGIMQLLQNHELVSWKLPKNWHIVLTANPDGGDYSVTPMDNAMVTRMMHITMTFDTKSWAKWAEKSGVDSRGINFILTYPESTYGERTTPRSLVQFFQSITHIEDFSDELPLIQMLGSSCLDQETVGSFIAFINQNLSQLISPKEVLKAKDFKNEVYIPIHQMVNKDILRVDIIATLCTRLVNYLIISDLSLSKEVISNIQQFIKMDFIPNDIRLAMLQDIMQSPSPKLKSLVADPSIAIILLSKM